MLGDATIRLLVADGSRIHTHLLAEALGRDSDLFAIPFDPSGGLLAAVKNNSVDVVLMSSTLDEQPSHGFAVLRELRASIPQLRAVMLLDSSADESVLQAFRSGARGVVSRNEPVGTLNECVRRVHDGQIWANPKQLAVAIESLASTPEVRAVNAKGLSLLSKRELQIVRSLAEGLTNREIAQRLKLSQHTVKNYLFRVFDKLGVSSRVELLFMTMSAGVQPPQKNLRLSENQANGDEFSMFLRAAQSGLPVPQLALAQMYVSLQKEPRDLVQAYAWYQLSAHCGLQTKEQMEGNMSAPQIAEAHEQTKAWLTQLQTEIAAPRPLAVRRSPPSGDSAHTATVKETAMKENEKAKAARPF
jgi:two-component system nitrate/nitrite response regulator NarL